MRIPKTLTSTPKNLCKLKKKKTLKTREQIEANLTSSLYKCGNCNPLKKEMCQIALYCQGYESGLLTSSWSTMLCSVSSRITLPFLNICSGHPRCVLSSFIFLESVPTHLCLPTPHSLHLSHCSKNLPHRSL